MVLCSLSELVTTRTGVTMRNFTKKAGSGDFFLLQPRDVQDGIIIENPGSIEIDKDEFSSLFNHVLKYNDLLIVNKGLNFNTLLFKDNFPNCLASSSFFIIKIDDTKCQPDYLNWYLNQQETKEYFIQNSVHSTVSSLKKSSLDKLPVKLPPLEIQRKIVKILDTTDKQEKTLRSLIQASREYCDSYIWELIEQKIIKSEKERE
jgi:restriction endonuclease S subunit